MMLLYNGINKSTLRVLIGFFKFPDIVELKTCLLFYDYFYNEKFPNLPVSLAVEVNNYNARNASSDQKALSLPQTNLTTGQR